MSDVLIVTGASRGIGASTARLAAARGWKVATSYLERREPAEAVVAEIRAAGGEAITVQADTAREDDVTRLFDAAQTAFGPITGLVNNAGINGGTVRFADLSLDALQLMMNTNVIGAFLCAREAVRRMSTARGGKGGLIVNVGSLGAKLGSPNERVHYAASKGAIATMTIGLAKEVGPEGIRVNCVHPGATETEMNPPERVARIAPGTPLRRAAHPDEIARVILFLLSSESSFMTGAEVPVTGGR